MSMLPGARRVLLAVNEYDFALDGGAVGTINLRGLVIPQDSIITDTLLIVHVALTGGTITDTLSLGAETLIDLQAAAARNAAPWSTAGARRITLNATAVPIRATIERRPRFTINGTALTAGRFTLITHFIPHL